MTSKICKIGCNISQNHTSRHPFFFCFITSFSLLLKVEQINFYKWYLLVFESISSLLCAAPLPITHHQVLHLFCRKLSRRLSLVLSRMKSESRQVLHLFFSLQHLTLFPLAPHSACSLAARREVTRVPLHASPRVDSPGLRRWSAGRTRSRQSVGSAARFFLFLHHPQLQKASATTPSQADEDALRSAAFNGNVKEVLRLLDKGVNKECKDLVHVFCFSLLWWVFYL